MTRDDAVRRLKRHLTPDLAAMLDDLRGRLFDHVRGALVRFSDRDVSNLVAVTRILRDGPVNQLYQPDLSKLEKLADENECDGNCDEIYPYKSCPGCMATGAINEAGEILHATLSVIEKGDPT